MSHDIAELQMKQAAPLSVKIRMTQQRIREWVNHWGLNEVYISFSGGKDSTVLLTIAREMYPSIKAVFIDTGLEYPEIRDFVKTWNNVDWVRPKMNFKQVIEKYGYPFISKEVSECVYGARKYLTYVAEQNSLDRPTDRPAGRPTDRTMRIDMKDCADSESLQSMTRGGGTTTSTASSEASQSKAERVWNAIQYCQKNGIGRGGSAKDFANVTGIRTNKPREVDATLWNGYADFSSPDNPTEQRKARGGGGNALWRFGAVCGVLTAQNTIDARLSENYRQLSRSTLDGDSSSEGESNDGEYP